MHELLRTVGLVPPEDDRREVPARALGRAAAARRDRARARGRAEGRPRRRADQHARRLDPDRDPEPDAASSRRSATSRSSTSRTTSRARATSPTTSSSCTRGRSSSAGRSSRCCRRRCIRTRACCSPPCPIPRRGCTPSGSRCGKGRASAAVDPPEGCRFVTRCPLAIDVCSHVTPPLVEARPAHAARCHVTAPSTTDREDNHAHRHELFSRRLHLGRRDRVVPDRGRGARGRTRRERLGPVLRDAGQGPQRRLRRGRVRLLPPLSATTSR